MSQKIALISGVLGQDGAYLTRLLLQKANPTEIYHLGAAFPYAYIDLELAGENNLFADAMVYLTCTAVFGDYFTPKYFPSQFDGKKWPFKALEKSKG